MESIIEKNFIYNPPPLIIKNLLIECGRWILIYSLFFSQVIFLLFLFCGHTLWMFMQHMRIGAEKSFTCIVLLDKSLRSKISKSTSEDLINRSWTNKPTQPKIGNFNLSITNGAHSQTIKEFSQFCNEIKGMKRGVKIKYKQRFFNSCDLCMQIEFNLERRILSGFKSLWQIWRLIVTIVRESIKKNLNYKYLWQ